MEKIQEYSTDLQKSGKEDTKKFKIQSYHELVNKRRVRRNERDEKKKSKDHNFRHTEFNDILGQPEISGPELAAFLTCTKIKDQQALLVIVWESNELLYNLWFN